MLYLWPSKATARETFQLCNGIEIHLGGNPDIRRHCSLHLTILRLLIGKYEHMSHFYFYFFGPGRLLSREDTKVFLSNSLVFVRLQLTELHFKELKQQSCEHLFS